MAKPRLNPALLAKMAKKKRATAQRIREGISHRASRIRVAPEAAQLIWADQMRIGIGGALGKLPPHIQQQVREHTSGKDDRRADRTHGSARARNGRRTGDPLREAVNRLITDPDLVEDCADTLKASRRFGRAIASATTILEHRLRKIAKAGKETKAPALVTKVLHAKAPLIRISDDDDEQNGYFSLAMGTFQALRNPAHHRRENVSREHAIIICGFVNIILDAIAKGRPQAVAAPAPSPAASAPEVP